MAAARSPVVRVRVRACRAASASFRHAGPSTAL